eukprot:m.86209 g.86209  ORF g.86209 m.86209 type:complete len:701 (+) comp12208_c3_seq1:55-2157(+)
MSDGSDIIRLGWLKKSPPPGAMNRWKRRFFCFRKGSTNGKSRLEYYPDGNMTSVKGVITLSECSAVVNNEDSGKHKFLFRLNTAHRVFLLEAASEEERATWVDALSQELFQNNNQPAVVSTVPTNQPQQVPSMQTLATPTMPSQTAPRRTSISVKRQPMAPSGSCERSHHPQPVGPFQWLYGTISRQQTESLLADYGLPTGLFLIRQKPGSYAISVCAQGKVVHHLLVQQVDGSFALNGKPLVGIISLEEVVDYLEQPKGPPLNWRQSLTYCPKAYDAQHSQQQPQQPPMSAHNTTATLSAPSGPTSMFTVTIVATPDTKCINVMRDQVCNVIVGADAIAVQSSGSGAILGSWILLSVYDYGCDSGTFFFKTNASHAPGHFRFLTGDPFDIMAAVRSNLPSQEDKKVSRGAMSMRVPVANKQPNINKFATLTTKKPPKVVPRQPSIQSDAQVSMATISEAADYEEPIDISVLEENEGKPLPPLSTTTTTNNTGTGKFDKSFLDKMNTHLQQPPQVRPKPKQPQQTEEAQTDMMPNTNKRMSVQEMGVAMPGIGLDINKALSGLKKTSTIPRKAPPKPPQETISEEEQSQQQMDPIAEQQQQEQEEEEVSKAATLKRQEKVEDNSGVLYLAGCDYDPQGQKGKLPFMENDVINILKCDNDSWWLGELNGVRGWVPASFMDVLPEDYTPPQPYNEDDDDAEA